MPTLPLDHALPLIATIGVMLYPGPDKDDRRWAAAYAAHYRNQVYRQFLNDGGALTPEIKQGLTEEDKLPPDVKKRWFRGVAAGNVFKVLFGLIQKEPELASWNHAIQVVSDIYTREGLAGSRAHLWAAKRQFLEVAHLWCAYCIRDGKFRHQPEIGYDLNTDFQYFLYEAELLRYHGRSYHQDRDKAVSFLPREGWCVPRDWPGPKHDPSFPQVPGAGLRYANLPELIQGLRTSGRPRKMLGMATTDRI